MKKMSFNKMILLLSLILTLRSFLPNMLYAATLTETTPSGIPYDDLGKEIEKYIEAHKDVCASVSVAVFKNNETLFSTQYGFMNIEKQIPVNEETVYEWGSISKLLIWTSVMQLYEQGKIDLNKDIREYLPDNFLTKLSYDEPITMLHLMNHSAGWQETTYALEVSSIDEIVDLETALRNTEPPQVNKPGTVTAYSNWGAALAALIVQEVSGENYVDYVHKHILEPLGMNQTSIAADYSDNQWVQEQRKLLNCYWITDTYRENLGDGISYILLYPAGAATGTLKDLMTFAKAFVPKEGEKSPLFQKKETLERMKETSAFYGDTDIPRVCHGFLTLQYTKDIMGHPGNTNGFTSTLMFEPESGLGVVIMSNQLGETVFNYGILSLIFGDYGNHQRVLDNPVLLKNDISGIYTSCRSYEKGFASIYKYIGGLLPLSKTEDENIYKLSLGKGKVIRIADHQYIMDNENALRYLMVETKNSDGHTVLQMMGCVDMVKEDPLSFGVKMISILLFFIIILISIFKILFKGLFFVIRKIGRKEESISHKKLHRIYIIMTIENAIVAFTFYYLILAPVTWTRLSVMIQCMVLAIAVVISLINTVIMIKQWDKKNLTKPSKRRYIATVVESCYISLFIIYWQLFNFWSC